MSGVWIVQKECRGASILFQRSDIVPEGRHVLIPQTMVTESESRMHPTRDTMYRKKSCLLFLKREYVALLIDSEALKEVPRERMPAITKHNGFWEARSAGAPAVSVRGSTPAEAVEAYTQKAGLSGTVLHEQAMLDALEAEGFSLIPHIETDSYRIYAGNVNLGWGRTDTDAFNTAVCSLNFVSESVAGVLGKMCGATEQPPGPPDRN